MMPGRSPTPSPSRVGEATWVDLIDDAPLPPVVAAVAGARLGHGRRPPADQAVAATIDGVSVSPVSLSKR